VLDNNTKVSDAMTRGALTVQEDDPMVKAVEAFVDHHVGAFMVTDAAGELVGVLSVIDVMKAFRDILAR
jgi:acetoin utilization protein AcuB